MIKESKIHGLGFFASRDFKEGEVIYKDRLSILTKRPKDPMTYLDNEVLYNLKKSSLRFLNHQHDNNAEWYDFSERDIEKGEIVLEAVRDIKRGEEVTINYRQEEFN